MIHSTIEYRGGTRGYPRASSTSSTIDASAIVNESMNTASIVSMVKA